MRSQQASGLARLAPDTWRLAEVAAAMSQPFSLDALAPVVGQPLGRLQPALSDALAAGVLLQTGTSLRFRHDVVRQAIYYETPVAQRMSWHRRIEGVASARRGTRAHPSEAGRPRFTERARAVAGRLDGAGAEGSAGAATAADVACLPPSGWAGTSDVHRARTEAETILGGAGESDARLVAALADLAFVAWNEGRAIDAIGLLRTAARRAERCQDKAAGHSTQLGVAVVLTALADVEGADRAIGRLHRAVRMEGNVQWAAVPAVLRCRLSLAFGPADEASAAAEEACDAGRQEQETPFRAAVLLVLAQLSLNRAELETADGFLERLAAEPTGRTLCDGTSVLWIRARLAEARQGAAAAYDLLGSVYADPVAHTRLLLGEPLSGPWLVRVALAAGHPDAAVGMARWAEQLAALNRPCPTMANAGRHARALVDHDAAALERLGTGHTHPGGRAAACEDAGIHLAAAGERGPSRLQFERAMAIFDCMGATGDQGRLRQRLGELATGSLRHRARCRPVSGWASLTDAERRVADLVATGLSNVEAAERLFLSRHTIDFHLRHVFRKLNVGSRVELARVALMRD